MKSLIVLIPLFLIYSCSFRISGENVIKIVGSDTMLELTLNLAEEYMKDNPGISITVEGGGTATGIKALIADQTDICTASRNLKPEEARMLADYYGSLGLVYLIAKDALSVYVNKKNIVTDISLTQLKKIYSGKTTTWRDLGGDDIPVTPVIRNPNSGTYLYFKEHVLEGENYIDDVAIEPTTKSIIKRIEEDESAIGYGGMGYRGDVAYAKINGIEPTEENVINDTYPIIRYLHFLTTRTPRGEVKKFIDWVLSPSGQSVVRSSGFIPLWENKL